MWGEVKTMWCPESSRACRTCTRRPRRSSPPWSRAAMAGVGRGSPDSHNKTEAKEVPREDHPPEAARDLWPPCPTGGAFQRRSCAFAETSASPKVAPGGKACSFPHVSGLPKALQEKAVSAQGLLLGSLGISTRAEEGVWKSDPAKEKEVLANLTSSPASAKPHGEVGGLGEQEEDEWDIEGMDRATLETILEGSGFGGPGHH